ESVGSLLSRTLVPIGECHLHNRLIRTLSILSLRKSMLSSRVGSVAISSLQRKLFFMDNISFLNRTRKKIDQSPGAFNRQSWGMST
ncbi:hypothetical protein V2J09_004392, partial [Rumex salicifolius]